MCNLLFRWPVACITMDGGTSQTFQKDSFETSSAGEDQEALSGGDAAVATPEPSSPKTVAEKLKRVQSQETELLRQFEDTHKLRAQARSGSVYLGVSCDR